MRGFPPAAKKQGDFSRRTSGSTAAQAAGPGLDFAVCLLLDGSLGNEISSSKLTQCIKLIPVPKPVSEIGVSALNFLILLFLIEGIFSARHTRKNHEQISPSRSHRSAARYRS